MNSIRVVLASLALAGCVGSAEDSDVEAGLDPSTAVSADTAASCGALQHVAGVHASVAQDGNPASNVLDGNLATRWSGSGVGAALTLDLGTARAVCGVNVAWYAGATRTNDFTISLSADGSSFTQVYDGTSSGRTGALETYAVSPRNARYVRLTVNGNSVNTWASVTEVSIAAAADAFVLGTTVPDASNTGVLPGVARTTYTGPSIITASNQTFRNMDFHSLITVRASDITFENCFFHGGATAPTTNTALVDCRASSVYGIVFDRCSFSPTDPSIWTDAVIGHDYTANRCYTERTVDGFGVYNAYAPALNVHLTGNDVANMSRYDDDPNHPDGTGTHNDCVQLQGGQGLVATGNAFHATAWYEGDPTRAAIPIGHTVLTQYNAYHPVGDIHVNQNFMYGGSDGLRFFSQRGPGVGGGYQAYAVEAVDNVWMDDDQKDFGGSLHWYTLRIDSNITLNGRTYPTTGGTDDAHGNRYGTSAAVDPTRRGQPIKIRCDAFPSS